MVDLRRDVLTGATALVAPGRAARPSAPVVAPNPRTSPSRSCPFCPGNEAETPAEVDSEGTPDRWQVRVFANKYPVLDRHEVLVFAPEHDAELADLTDPQVALCLAVAARRLRAFADDPAVAATMFVVNEGRGAGASLDHPHGQLLGLPVTPPTLTAEMPDDEGCKACRAVDAERAGPRLLLDEGATVYAPWASAWPYELVVAPPHLDPFERAGAQMLYDVGRALRRSLAAVRVVTGGAPYNLFVHSGMGHWHVHVVPRVTVPGGIELGAGITVNPVDPDAAAAALREALPR